MNPLRVFTAFSGYDSQCMSLDRLSRDYPHFSYELVGWSEIDKYAIEAHNAVYPQWSDRNFGDISKVDWDSVPYFDLFTYSFPCQAVSSAGKQEGLAEGSGTTSSLLWECRKCIAAKHPYFLLMENVSALTQKKFMPYFQSWIDYLESEGYHNFWTKMNAKDYGIPQNRVRVFMVSIHNSALAMSPQLFPNGIHYEFPEGFALDRRLKDVLETYHDGKTLDEKYYLRPQQIAGRLARNETATDNHKFKFTDGGGMGGHLQPVCQRHCRHNNIKD